ncbi:MAG TPA: ABC transporter ATP-binding protein, partial [Syntrophobacteraceae bacterium]|nr:ABC transporter ATP-binding protein [Syntrophobacteraceae bacterium]
MLKKTFKYLWPYRFPFLIALAQVFIMSGCELLKPWPLKIIIDNVLSGKPAPWGIETHFTRATLLILAATGLVIIYAVLGGVTLLNNYTTIKIGQKMVNDMRRDLYAHLQRLSLAFHSRRQVGDLLYRVTADTFAIQSLTMNGVFPIVTAVVLLAGMFYVMIKIDWQLTAFSLAVCPALLASIVVMSRRITEAAMVARRQESEVFSVVQRAMSAIRIIQAFTKEEDEHRKFMSASNQSLGASLRLYTLQTLYSGVVNVVMAV